MKYHFSIFTHLSGDDFIPFQIRTFVAVPVNEDMIFSYGIPSGSAPITDGTITVIVMHDQEMDGVYLSSESGRLSSSPLIAENSSEIEIGFAPNETTYFLSATSQSGESRYGIITSSQKGQAI